MALILSCIAILLTLLLCFFFVKERVGKQSPGHVRSRITGLEERLDDIQKQVHTLADQLDRVESSLAQAHVASSEVSTLKAKLGCIRSDLQAKSQLLSIHSQAIDAINEKQSVFHAPALKSIDQQVNSIPEQNRLPQGSRLFPSLETYASFEFEQPIPIQTAEDFSPFEAPPAQQPYPFEQVVQQYQDALDRGDRQALRQMQVKELNITSESEDSLLRGSSGQATKLEAVLGGGSYMVVSGEGRYWLFPTAQTLDSFSMNQPQKGIFSYEREILSKPVVKKPAEVREEGVYWAVTVQGVISIPG